MRPLLLPLVFHLLLLAAGVGILRRAGLLARLTLTGLMAAGGLAYLCGVAVVMQVCVLLLVLGVPFGLPTVALVALICAGVAIPGGGWRELVQRPTFIRPSGVEGALIALSVLAFFALAIVGLITLGNRPLGPGDYDAWNLWARRGELMFLGSHLPLGVISSPTSGYIHQDYPFVVPLLDAMHLRALGRLQLSSVHTVEWILAVCFVWAGAFLAGRRARPAVLLVFPAAMLLNFAGVLTGYADLPMVFFLCLGVLALGLWLRSGDRAELAVGAVLLGGAAGIKNEGFFGCIIALVVAFLVVAVSRRQLLRNMTIAGAGVTVIALIPWRLYLAAHHLRGDESLTKALSPSYLADHFSRVWPSIKALHDQFVGTGSVAVFIPIGIALLLVSLRRPRCGATATFFLATGFLYFVSLVWAYWVSPLDIGFHINTSVNRIFLGVAFIAVASIGALGETYQSEQLSDTRDVSATPHEVAA